MLSVHISRLTSPSVVLGGDPLTIDCDFDYQVFLSLFLSAFVTEFMYMHLCLYFYQHWLWFWLDKVSASLFSPLYLSNSNGDDPIEKKQKENVSGEKSFWDACGPFELHVLVIDLVAKPAWISQHRMKLKLTESSKRGKSAQIHWSLFTSYTRRRFRSNAGNIFQN